jgi:integrase
LIHLYIVDELFLLLLLTGARREELAELCWDNVDFRWKSILLKDKVEGERIIPLTPYVAYLLDGLPRVNQWVFSSPRSESGRIAEPRIAHNRALLAGGLPHLLAAYYSQLSSLNLF